jgi:hypothetical protein
VKVEDEEVEALYAERYGKHQEAGDSVHVRQILRAYGGAAQRTQEAACAEVRLARDRIVGGEPFEKVAAQVSEAAPRDGGDIGWLPLKSVAPWMSKALAGCPTAGQRGARAAVRLRGAPARRAARARAGQLCAGEGRALARALGAQARAGVPDLDRGAARAAATSSGTATSPTPAKLLSGRIAAVYGRHDVERVHGMPEVERLEPREARPRRPSGATGPRAGRACRARAPPGSESADDMHVSTDVPYISAAIGFLRTFAS